MQRHREARTRKVDHRVDAVFLGVGWGGARVQRLRRSRASIVRPPGADPIAIVISDFFLTNLFMMLQQT